MSDEDDTPEGSGPNPGDVASAPTPDGREPEASDDDNDGSRWSDLTVPLVGGVSGAALYEAAQSTESAPSADEISDAVGVSRPAAKVLRAGLKATKAVGLPVPDSIGGGDGEPPAYIEAMMGVAEWGKEQMDVPGQSDE